jgi:hypothetical protein
VVPLPRSAEKAGYACLVGGLKMWDNSGTAPIVSLGTNQLTEARCLRQDPRHSNAHCKSCAAWLRIKTSACFSDLMKFPTPQRSMVHAGFVPDPADGESTFGFAMKCVSGLYKRGDRTSRAALMQGFVPITLLGFSSQPHARVCQCRCAVSLSPSISLECHCHCHYSC